MWRLRSRVGVARVRARAEDTRAGAPRATNVQEAAAIHEDPQEEASQPHSDATRTILFLANS